MAGNLRAAWDNLLPRLFRLRRLRFATLFIAIFLGLLHLPTLPAVQSSYALSLQAPFNRLDYYPLEQTPDPSLYRSAGEWLGRLILPTPEQLQTEVQSDWTWIELYNTPPEAQDLVGTVVRMTWQDTPELQDLVKKVTTDVDFDEAALTFQQDGNVLPERLNGRSQVGPLQSLAGARPYDDIVVRLEQVAVDSDRTGAPLLHLAQLPVQVTGRYVGLVRILGPDPAIDKPANICPGVSPCPGEYYRVRHYNTASGDFDGPFETVRIPQQPMDRNGRFLSTPRQIAESPAGVAGWYLYGAQDAEGVFTVRAMKPRALVQLQLDRVILGKLQGLRFIRWQNWQNTPELKGTLQRSLVSPDADDEQSAQQAWQLGDRALLIHNFGGIGGEKGEGTTGGTVTGHFAFGIAEVVTDPFTQELQFDIRYHQIYAQNTNGIVSGSVDWSAYAGDLQRGWFGSRPLSEVLLKLDAFNNLNLGDRQLSLLQELWLQTEIIAARYRTGDGTGLAAVTPATSCVQDSSQALYIAIQQMKQQVNSSPELVALLEERPEDPATLQFQQMMSLGRTLEAELAPYGVVRADWKQNAEVLAGVDGVDRFTRGHTLWDGLLSWRTMLPRQGHDEITRIFLKHGAQLWILRSNQALGWDPTIAPLAPTLLFGERPLVSIVLRRLVYAVFAPFLPGDGAISLGILAGFAALALPLGLRSGFLSWQPAAGSIARVLCSLAKLFAMPALLEELIFRAVLLPHPAEGLSLMNWGFWGGLSLALFVLHHPLSASIYYRAGNPTFFNPIFLTLSGLLGLACMLAYAWTGSLWMAVIIHWIVVAVWIWLLGGKQRFSSTKTPLELSR